MTRSTLTFVGPLVSSSSRPQRGGPWHFRLAQAGGGDPIKLEYATKDEARSARRTIMGNPGAHTITTNKLFEAIHEALVSSWQAGVGAEKAAAKPTADSEM